MRLLILCSAAVAVWLFLGVTMWRIAAAVPMPWGAIEALTGLVR